MPARSLLSTFEAVSVLFLAVELSACGANPHTAPGIRDALPAHLQVENRSFADLRIYVVLNDASRFSLGTVSSFSTQRLTLPRSIIGGRNIRLVAAPLALGEPTAVEVQVYEGDTLIWYLENNLLFSRLVKR